MASIPQIGVSLVDADGSFARFKKNAPKEMRAAANDVIKRTCFALHQRMKGLAPVGPDSPHIRDAVTYEVKSNVSMSGQVGFINATELAGPGNTATLADVALFNEYAPNKQPFMRPAAEAEASNFAKRMKDALAQVERALSTSESIGTGGSTSTSFTGTRRGAAGTGGQVRGN